MPTLSSSCLRNSHKVFLALLVVAPVAQAQLYPMDSSSVSMPVAGITRPLGSGPAQVRKWPRQPSRPFSRVAFGSGMSTLGVRPFVATNIDNHLDIRANGNYFKYTISGIQSQGFNATAKVNFASSDASLDYYPFHAGFRISPGVMFYNKNQTTVNFAAPVGTGFTLGNYTFYSAGGANAVQGIGHLGLGSGTHAFTVTTGWGSLIPRSGRHISFPFEIGVAFLPPPTVSLALTGLVCDSKGQNCVDVSKDATAQSNITAQVATYVKEANPLKTFPIASFGVAYNFNIRKRDIVR